jgi:hypothetical protein
MRVKVTSPSGLWDYQSLLGASVKIKSLSVKAGFAYDGNSTYQIKSIGFRMSSIGKSYTVITLDGLPGKEFVWKDLEIIGLRIPMWKPAMCGMFCAGEAICGYGVIKDTKEEESDSTVKRIKPKVSTTTTITTSGQDKHSCDCDCCIGDIIDGGNL